MESKIVFEVGEDTIVRHGNTSTAHLIAQATAEFGQIHVTEQVEGESAPPEQPHKHVLTATKFNLQTSYDQLASLNDDFPMRDAKAHVASAIALIEQELENLG